MSHKFLNFFREIRPNAAWDFIKLGVGVMLASLAGLGYWFIQQYREAPFSVIVMFSIFGISFIGTLVLFGYQKLKGKQPAEKQWYETPENDLTPEKSKPKNKEQTSKPTKQKPVIIAKKGNLEMVGYARSKVIPLIKTNTMIGSFTKSTVVVAPFYNKPVENHYSISKLKAIITFYDLNGEEIDEIKGYVWLDRFSDENGFAQGAYIELGIAFLEDNRLYLLEREYLENCQSYRPASYSFRELKGSDFIVDIKLMAFEFFGDFISEVKFKYRLITEPEFKFDEIKDNHQRGITSKTDSGAHKIVYVKGVNPNVNLTSLNERLQKTDKKTGLYPLLATFENLGEHIDGVQAQISYFGNMTPPLENISCRVNPAIWFEDTITDKVSFQLHKNRKLLLGVFEYNTRKKHKHTFTPLEFSNGKTVKKLHTWLAQPIYIRIRLFTENKPLGEYKFKLNFPPTLSGYILSQKDFEAE